MSTAADRPAPEPARLLAALDEHGLGDATPGTTVQSLKRGGLDLLLAGVSEGSEHAELAGIWDGWERGRTPPGPLLEALEAAGIRAFLAELDAAGAGGG